MTDQSRTPRTDAMAVVCYGEGGIERSIGFRAVPLKDARTLELEAADLRERLAIYESDAPEGRKVTNAQFVEMRERLVKARAEAIEECWQAVNALIHEGELPQELHDRRNGLVLASNAISALANPKGEDHGGENAKQHQWSEDGERCLKCGDKDWMGGPCNG